MNTSFAPNCDTATTGRQSHVTEAVMRLERQVDEVEALTEKLVGRLEKVLRVAPPELTGEQSVAKSDDARQTPLAGSLIDVANRVKSISGILKDINGRLEL